MSKVLVISTSLRAKSNSDILTEKLIEGAKASDCFRLFIRILEETFTSEKMYSSIPDVTSRIRVVSILVIIP